jgi:hypothetical protein
MKLSCWLLVATLSPTLMWTASGTTHYVDLNSTNPVPPYSGWGTAATNIQDAVDTSTNGDLILVTNGVYQYGSRVSADGTTNRLIITNAVTLQSINGPAVTSIDGNSTVRCAYLADGSLLTGFAVTHGSAQNGAGVFCTSVSALLSNCVLAANSGAASSQGGGTFSGSIYNCTLSNNTSLHGAGAALSALYNCNISSNSGTIGGGVWSATLNNCTLDGNFARSEGGGAYQSTLTNCTLAGNVVQAEGLGGGGAASSTLDHCLLTGNQGYQYGGGAWNSVLYNCQVISNSAPPPPVGSMNPLGGGLHGCVANNCLIMGNVCPFISPPLGKINGSGGGAWRCDLTNCTVVNNSAVSGGGVEGGYLYNCIVYDNTCLYAAHSSSNYDNPFGSLLMYNCCTAPSPGAAGTLCITNSPGFVNPPASDFRLQSNSPCINSGNNAYFSSATDLDGNPRISGGTVDIGAYEFQNPASVISYAWLQQYGLLTDGSADFTDPDRDGMNNYQEWIAGTNPTNTLSVLAMLVPVSTNNPPGLVVSWKSVSGINYDLQTSGNLAGQPAFSTIQSNIVGLGGTNTFTDTNATNAGPYFYRVGVQH